MRSEFFKEIAESRKRFLLEAATDLGMVSIQAGREIVSDKLPSDNRPPVEARSMHKSEPVSAAQTTAITKKKQSKINQLFSFLSF